jgi:hypothetical protein
MPDHELVEHDVTDDHDRETGEVIEKTVGLVASVGIHVR